MILIIWKLWAACAARWRWVPYGSRVQALMISRLPLADAQALLACIAESDPVLMEFVLGLTQEQGDPRDLTALDAARDAAALDDFRRIAAAGQLADIATSRALARRVRATRGLLNFAARCRWELRLMPGWRQVLFRPKRWPWPSWRRALAAVTVTRAVLARLRCAFLTVRPRVKPAHWSRPVVLIVRQLALDGDLGLNATTTESTWMTPALEAAMSP